MVVPKAILPQVSYIGFPTAKGRYTKLRYTLDFVLRNYTALELRPVGRTNAKVGLQSVDSFVSDPYHPCTYSPFDPPAARKDKSYIYSLTYYHSIIV
jgi:hypothetical protein